ncbi:LacI family transcriptional regulator [Hoeflea marina]|uniref:LacI family transcriptional regulator n=1 Tax=Hoeflea marina TaxID=274592 RepID=A0A317PTL2_9HYPH|nr:LacI family DNA-binding transcriptional regulator [Hoeflea marina]PWW04479.1 LacI family transcriptional regulator [Hoeflea marina]
MAKNSRKSGKPTLTDVARAANVSAITASRALRNPDSVSAILRERISQAVRAIGYVPDTAARALASSHTNVIGIIIPSVTNSVYTDVLRGIYDAIETTPFQVQLGNTNYSSIKEEELLRLFLGQRPAALMVTGHDQSRDAAQLLAANNCPVVQIMDLPPEPFDMAVGFDHRDAAEAATRNLIARSYRRIGFLAAQMDTRTRQRLDGYVRAMTEAGLFDERMVVTTHKTSSVFLGQQLLSEFMARFPDADAIQANNDDIALGALFECQRRRMRVPEDFGISGFNDFDIASAVHPTLTSVKTYRYEMGHKAIEMLIAAVAGHPPAERTVDLGFELIERESTARNG